MKPIVIQSTFCKATTTADGGWRLSFDTGEEMSESVTELAKRKHEVLFLVVMNKAQFDTHAGTTDSSSA